MDHCFTQLPSHNKMDETDNSTGIDVTFLRPATGNKTYIIPDRDASEITLWFCRFLRSTFNSISHKGMQSCGDTCTVCPGMIEHIETKCHSAYLDSQCLKMHEHHLGEYGFRTEMDNKVTNNRMVLAHYHPDGVFLKVFPVIEGNWR